MSVLLLDWFTDDEPSVGDVIEGTSGMQWVAEHVRLVKERSTGAVLRESDRGVFRRYKIEMRLLFAHEMVDDPDIYFERKR